MTGRFFQYFFIAALTFAIHLQASAQESCAVPQVSMSSDQVRVCMSGADAPRVGTFRIETGKREACRKDQDCEAVLDWSVTALKRDESMKGVDSGLDLVEKLRVRLQSIEKNAPVAARLASTARSGLDLLRDYPRQFGDRDPKWADWFAACASRWTIDDATFRGLTSTSDCASTDEVSLNQLLATTCGSQASAECAAGYNAIGEIVGVIKLVGYISTNIKQSDTPKYLALLDKQWDAYFTNGRSQTPFESAINNWRFKDSGFQGFRAPPTSQVIFLHPSAGFEYSRRSADKFQESLYLELLGFYKWSWNDDGTMRSPWGGSITLNVGDRPDAKRVGVGFLIHLPKNWSLGLMTRDSPTGRQNSIVLSLDLGKAIQDKKSLIDSIMGR